MSEPITVVDAVRIKILRSHYRDKVLLLPGSEISVSADEADWLIRTGKAVEISFIEDEVSL